jgi:hypothetical protein
MIRSEKQAPCICDANANLFTCTPGGNSLGLPDVSKSEIGVRIHMKGCSTWPFPLIVDCRRFAASTGPSRAQKFLRGPLPVARLQQHDVRPRTPDDSPARRFGCSPNPRRRRASPIRPLGATARRRRHRHASEQNRRARCAHRAFARRIETSSEEITTPWRFSRRAAADRNAQRAAPSRTGRTLHPSLGASRGSLKNRAAAN